MCDESARGYYCFFRFQRLFEGLAQEPPQPVFFLMKPKYSMMTAVQKTTA